VHSLAATADEILARSLHDSNHSRLESNGISACKVIRLHHQHTVALKSKVGMRAQVQLTQAADSEPELHAAHCLAPLLPTLVIWLAWGDVFRRCSQPKENEHFLSVSKLNPKKFA
jgi:hypothetical protein